MKFSSLARHGLVWLSLTLPVAAMAATPVFVNELHYDNAGTDVGEAIEIAGPAGTDLTGWSVVLYNGKHPATATMYDTLPLSGTITACTGMAYGVVVVAPVPPDGQIQNGDKDGLALVDAGGNVVQLLSYEGTFTASDGPAVGMTSVDIGVEEDSSTSIGESLQLTGDGTSYEDFTWTGPIADSFGSCNAGQTFGPPVDMPPTVTSTTPADNAIGVATNSALTVNFSEPVTLAAEAITLECDNSNQPGGITGSGSAYIFTPAPALPETASCTATVDATKVTDLDGTHNDPMAADYAFSFQTTGDFPPTVSSFRPADGATDVDVGTAVAVQFSEPVTLGTSAISLVCAGSGQAGTIAGSDADYTFTPTTALPYSAACITTVTAADVTDLDGSPTAMVSDATASFNTAADLPPSVSATVPADNGIAFPDADLAVTFSEPVTPTTGWYAIQCSDSGAHTAVQSGSGASYTLDPDADFTTADTCTLTITATDVHDATSNAMAANMVVTFTIVPSVADYYQGVDTSSGTALEAWLHTRLTTAPQPYTEIKAYPYSDSGNTDTWLILSQADQDPNNPANILDLYKNVSLEWKGGGTQDYNREHTWPKSLGFPDSSRNNKPNPPYTDTHMLHLADKDYNSQRGNGLLGDCPASVTCTPLWTVTNNGFGGDHGKHGDANWKDGDTLFEVWDHRKGDVARSLMYMAVRYDGGVDAVGICEPDLRLTDDPNLVKNMDAQNAAGCTGDANIAYNGLLSDLLLWNQQDPPDAQEELRNDLVFSYQHNRNPFVDHPEWAMCVFKNLDCPAANDLIFKDGFDTTSSNE